MNSKSSFSNSTSKSYAIALYELSKESSELDKVQEEMESLKKLILESIGFKEMILSPMLPKEDKHKVILKISEKYNFSIVLKKFLGFIINQNRLFYLEKIIESFLNLVSLNKGELKAKLVSSKRLSDEEKKKIEQELSSDFKSSLNINYEYDPNLVGGLIIQVGSIMIDTSIKTKLKKLEKNMMEV